MNIDQVDGQRADFFSELSTLIVEGVTIREFTNFSGNIASKPEYRGLFEVQIDKVAEAYKTAYESSGTHLNKVMAGFDVLVREPTKRKDITDYLSKFPEVFGDTEEYLKNLFQTGVLDAKKIGDTYELFRA